jgi:AbrB family looped-hinge helix DNA binding protein
MPHYQAKLSSKGQLTVPGPVREHFGLKTGDIVDFYVEKTERAVRMVARNKSIVELAGMLDAYRLPGGHAASLQEMNEAVGDHLAEKHERISREWNEWREFQQWKQRRDKRRPG